MNETIARHTTPLEHVSGEFVDLAGTRHYVIRNVDRMPPFLVSVVSSSDHWLFVSSTGALTAGRISPDTALFPYVTDDKLHEVGLHTGPRTLLRTVAAGRDVVWEPFNAERDGTFATSRNLYKSVRGDRLCFEEINHDLEIVFRYTWLTSARFGFIRRCELANLAATVRSIDLLDGLQNILPAGTPRYTQTNSSNLVDAYKWTEFDTESGLALFTLYAGITDRAEPCESLKTNVAYSLGLEAPAVLLSSQQIGSFRRGEPVHTETLRRGVRGAFLLSKRLTIAPRATASWNIVCDLELDQAAVVDLQGRLADPRALADAVEGSIERGSDDLARIMARCDALQQTEQEEVTVHHYANVLFNVLRGGYFPDHYRVSAQDFRETIRTFNRAAYVRSLGLLESLPDTIGFRELLASVEATGDVQLARLCREYLPITFGRRHGDPSRPWNQFAIRLKDRSGRPLYWYEGNWRDIFQNWEALAFSYPEFVENMIAKFVNASTMDGYNPYRITKSGIDWEVESPDDPWSYIGYWGDHQIIYLLRLLEISERFHPDRLAGMLREPLFAYANVPYRIRAFAALLENPKNTVDYDEALAQRIDQRVAEIGADGKLVLDSQGDVLQVTLIEKLIVPLLSKLGNLVVDGGIWMNTQRPEWNDANNALVGQGLSMVTLFHLRRYLQFLSTLLDGEVAPIEVSSEVVRWLEETAAALSNFRDPLSRRQFSKAQRMELLAALGEAAGRYRAIVYRNGCLSGKIPMSLDLLRECLGDALSAVDHSIMSSRRDDGLCHAYNLLVRRRDRIETEPLYAMLEGQVAILNSGAIGPGEAADLLDSLFASDLYRVDQSSFMLYPDRPLPRFLEKNRIPPEALDRIPLLRQLVADDDLRIIVRDAKGDYRFNSDFRNVGDLLRELASLDDRFDVESLREPLGSLFEQVFDHQSFTGRSGSMFRFEGLGCIYWHMISKLLLAVQEACYAALDQGSSGPVFRRLADLYYRVRAGLGFNKSPSEYGAFPTDPYSHTPRHVGASQPGMTGQVKEEVLTRFGELGIRVARGMVRFQPALLRRREFLLQSRVFRYLDIDGTWQEHDLPAGTLAFTWCQVPFVYRLDSSSAPHITLRFSDGREHLRAGSELNGDESAALFQRDGRIRFITVCIDPAQLLCE